MGRFPEQFIQQVLQATDIVDLVGRYVALKHKGRQFVGLCPFHDDKKPSMNVSPSKQIFKCFACGAGGDAVQFVMSYEKLTFPEAVRQLAEQANIPLPSDYAPAAAPAGGLGKNDLLAVMEFAVEFFRGQLHSPGGKEALQYARGRGFSDESIERFALGFAPDSWDAFIKAAAAKGLSETQLVTAGLARRRDNSRGCYDYFRNRLMFPIHDPGGRVVAFGGRALAEQEPAKYLNSPESVLFEKSSLLFALHLARETIVRSKQAVVVEGYLDALIPIQAGIQNVVATLGTALTERHVRLLGRYADQAVLLFDADTAGAAAAERALELFLAQKLHVRVATIPAGKDPCDYVLASGPDALRTLIDQAPDAMQYVWNRRQEALVASEANPAERNRLIEEFLTIIVSSGAYGGIDALRQQNLAQHIAHVVNVPAIDLQQQMRRLARKPRHTGPAGPAAGAHATPIAAGNPERAILEVLLDRPDLFDNAAERIDPQHFHDQTMRTIADKFWSLGRAGRAGLDNMLACEELAPLAAILAELSFAGENRGNHEETLDEAVQNLLDRQEHSQLQQMKRQRQGEEDLRKIHERISHMQEKGTSATRRPGIQ